MHIPQFVFASVLDTCTSTVPNRITIVDISVAEFLWSFGAELECQVPIHNIGDLRCDKQLIIHEPVQASQHVTSRYLQAMYVVIFRSTRTTAHDHEYGAWVDRMNTEVAEIDGYLSHTSFRDQATREGITVAYFTDENAIRRWREFPDHLQAQTLGRERFYAEYRIDVAEIVRSSTWSSCGARGGS